VREFLVAFTVLRRHCSGISGVRGVRQILVHFDLPAQPLAHSLKAIGTCDEYRRRIQLESSRGFMAPHSRQTSLGWCADTRSSGPDCAPQHLETTTISSHDPRWHSANEDACLVQYAVCAAHRACATKFDGPTSSFDRVRKTRRIVRAKFDRVIVQMLWAQSVPMSTRISAPSTVRSALSEGAITRRLDTS